MSECVCVSGGGGGGGRRGGGEGKGGGGAGFSHQVLLCTGKTSLISVSSVRFARYPAMPKAAL